MGIAIESEVVEKRFYADGAPAISGISTTIEGGRITGLVGPDGAGKTTLMRLFAGLLQPTSGRLRIEGLDPVVESKALHEILGYMPQKFGLYEDLTVLENLTLYADLRNVAEADRDARFKRLLAFTDLARFTDRQAGKLSGGMKQKLGLACTLLGSPRVLLLDEPSVGVDPISRRELWAMVYDLADDGMTVVWSTSYLDEAEKCQDVRLMNAGRIIASGAPDEIIGGMEGRSIQIRNISGSRRGVLQRALRAEQVMDGVIQGRSVRLVLRDAGQPPPMDYLEAGSQAQMVTVRPRLEDAFISILGGGPGGESVLASVMPDIRRAGSLAHDDDDTVIEADDLTKKFGPAVATNKISFRVRSGEIFGLLGPNGAGKSTTFRMLCGLLVPSAGRARVMGMDLKSSPLARQSFGYMAQKFSLYGNLSVQQNLGFFSGSYGLKGRAQDRKIRQMVDAFVLDRYLDTNAMELPLGFKQRLALACAIMHEPQILFLDEPTSGVDPITRREFWAHINGLVERGMTVMVTTHFMDEAEYCDRIAFIYRGSLIALGTPDELKELVVTADQPDPTMEDAFIGLVERAGR